MLMAIQGQFIPWIYMAAASLETSSPPTEPEPGPWRSKFTLEEQLPMHLTVSFWRVTR